MIRNWWGWIIKKFGDSPFIWWNWMGLKILRLPLLSGESGCASLRATFRFVQGASWLAQSTGSDPLSDSSHPILLRNVYPWWNFVGFQALATLVRIIVPWRRNSSMGHKIPTALPNCQDFVSESGSLESYNQVSIYFSYIHNGARRMVDLSHWKYVSFDFSSKGILPFSYIYRGKWQWWRMRIFFKQWITPISHSALNCSPFNWA